MAAMMADAVGAPSFRRSIQHDTATLFFSSAEVGSVSAGLKMTALKKNFNFQRTVNLKSLANGANGVVNDLFDFIYDEIKNKF